MSNKCYEYYIEQEDELVNQIDTCEKVLWYIQSAIYANRDTLHFGTLQKIVDTILELNLELQEDLYYIRLKKAEITQQLEKVGVSN